MKKNKTAVLLGIVCSVAMLCACEKTNINNTEEPSSEPPVSQSDDKSEITPSESDSSENNLTDDELEVSAMNIMEELSGYRIAILYEQAYDELEDPGSSYTVDFNGVEATKAAGYSLSVKHEEEYNIDDMTMAYHIDKDSMDEACKDLFGVDSDYSALKENTEVDEGLCMYYGTPMMKYTLYETDTDSVVFEQSAYADAGEISGTQYVYHGHWSGTDAGESNFEVDYIFEKNNESKYGLVLRKMIFYHIEEIWDGYKSYSAPCTALPDEGFYGIWVMASKKQEDAENAVGDMAGKGLDPCAILSSEWENLNPDPIYVVTIGIYDTESDAKAALDDVKAAGYKDAYVKFSGKRK